MAPSRHQNKSGRSFEDGQLVFAKVKYFPPWPAKIMKANAVHCTIEWFGSGGEQEVFHRDVFPYDEVNKEKFINEKSMQKKKFALAVEQIEAQNLQQTLTKLSGIDVKVSNLDGEHGNIAETILMVTGELRPLKKLGEEAKIMTLETEESNLNEELIRMAGMSSTKVPEESLDSMRNCQNEMVALEDEYKAVGINRWEERQHPLLELKNDELLHSEDVSGESKKIGNRHLLDSRDIEPVLQEESLFEEDLEGRNIMNQFLAMVQGHEESFNEFLKIATNMQEDQNNSRENETSVLQSTSEVIALAEQERPQDTVPFSPQDQSFKVVRQRPMLKRPKDPEDIERETAFEMHLFVRKISKILTDNLTKLKVDQCLVFLDDFKSRVLPDVTKLVMLKFPQVIEHFYELISFQSNSNEARDQEQKIRSSALEILLLFMKIYGVSSVTTFLNAFEKESADFQEKIKTLDKEEVLFQTFTMNALQELIEDAADAEMYPQLIY